MTPDCTCHHAGLCPACVQSAAPSAWAVGVAKELPVTDSHVPVYTRHNRIARALDEARAEALEEAARCCEARCSARLTNYEQEPTADAVVRSAARMAELRDVADAIRALATNTGKETR